MKPLLKQFVIFILSSALVACAGTRGDDSHEASPRGDCIHEPSIRGYTVLDERNLIIDAGRRSYHMVLQRRAFGLRSSWGIRFVSATGRVCAGFDELVFEGHMDGEAIRIDSIRAITPEEEEHLLIRFGKKEPEIEHTPPPSDVKGADVEELDPDDSE
jgi:hypothetical protein